MKTLKYLIVLLSSLLLFSCKFYSFTGVNINPELKSFTVSRVINQASTVNPNLAIDLQDALMDRLNRQTGLQEQPKNGDLLYDVIIESYTITPTSINSGEVASENKFQIGIKCVFTNSVEETKNFEKSFSANLNYASTLSLQDAESQYLETLVEELVDRVFNESLVNW